MTRSKGAFRSVNLEHTVDIDSLTSRPIFLFRSVTMTPEPQLQTISTTRANQSTCQLFIIAKISSRSQSSNLLQREKGPLGKSKQPCHQSLF